MKKNIIKILKFLINIFKIFPIKNNKIILISFYNKYCLDMKAIGEYLKKTSEYDLYLGTIGSVKLYENIKVINIRSITGIFHLMTAKAIIYSINAPSYIPYRKKQLLINTWHGNGIKKRDKVLDSSYFSKTKCFTSYSEKYTQIKLRESFNFKGEVLSIGAPKNDIFFLENKEKIIKKIKEELNICEKKILLYAPTFRNMFEEQDTSIEFDKLKKELENKFGGEWIILFRVHPSLVNNHKSNNDTIDVSSYNDMQELLLISDILITDYSSSAWDFGIQLKPIFIYAPDIEEYIKNDRGFIIPIEEWPYSIAKNNKELINIIKEFNEKDYVEIMKKYYKECGSYEKGNACEKLLEYIKNN